MVVASKEAKMKANEKFDQWFKVNGVRKGWFAAQIGVGSQSISKWVKGTTKPSAMARKVIEEKTGGAVLAEEW